MPCVNARVMVHDARSGGYAVPAFDVETCDMAEAVVRAVNDARSPMILQVVPHILDLMGWGVLSRHFRDLAEHASVPVALHLDHALTVDDALKGLDYGFTSVMYDGSALPVEDNLAKTRTVVDRAHPEDVTVEGEIGHVGRDGEPEGLEHLTSVEEALSFARATEVDFLAVAIGTRHGHSPGPGGIDLGRLRELSDRVGVPLVLHGGSGVPRAMLAEAVPLGLAKVNVGTALNHAYLETARGPGESPADVVTRARTSLQAVAASVIDTLGSAGRA